MPCESGDEVGTPNAPRVEECGQPAIASIVLSDSTSAANIAFACERHLLACIAELVKERQPFEIAFEAA